jgi:methionyl-tRNA formyltransferase
MGNFAERGGTLRSLKIVYAGTPEFAKIILSNILNTPHQVVLVMTQPDRPSGRGLKIHPSSVKELALEKNIPLLQPTSLKLDGKYPVEAQLAKATLENLEFDVMVVAAYGLILPKWLLDLVQAKSKLGCINVHASLLPRWRGAAPIHRAIWSGDDQTGTCIMKMAEGLDTGPIIAQENLSIQNFDTTQTLHDRLALQGARLLNETLDSIARGEDLVLHEQSEIGVTYAQKILKEEALIDWHQDAKVLDRQIRALNPSPVAFTHLMDTLYKFWLCEDVSSIWAQRKTGKPGQVLEINDYGIEIACGTGVLRIIELQKAGSKRMSAKQFMQTNAINISEIFK